MAVVHIGVFSFLYVHFCQSSEQFIVFALNVVFFSQFLGNVMVLVGVNI